MKIWITLLLWPALLLARGASLDYGVEGADSLTIGDPFTLWMEASAGEGGTLAWPPADLLNLGACGLLVDTVLVTQGGERREMTLAAYETGPLALPPQVVSWKRGGDEGQLRTDSLRITVRSVLDYGVPLEDAAQAMTEPQPREIVPPLEVHHGPLWYVIRLAIVLAALLLVWLFWRWWRRPRILDDGAQKALPVLDPWETWQMELGRIQHEQLWRTGDVVEYWAQLSLALRGLLEDSMQRPAREMTSYEIEELLHHAPFGEPARQRLLELLRENDLVKYARQWPSDERNRQLPADYIAWAEEVKPGLMGLYHARQAAEAEAERQPVTVDEEEDK